MSHRRAQEQSLAAAADPRLGVVRTADSVAHQAVLERARPGLSIGRDHRPVLPDAIRDPAGRPILRTALEQSEIARFRAVLGGRRYGQEEPSALDRVRTACHAGRPSDNL